mmetsp:Transcript_49106/g.71727  ORF Transcript_49106/g.71727 Transcript_49106/m.71727 type:complete len:92 (-) Transcript_49106:170-445(-)
MHSFRRSLGLKMFSAAAILIELIVLEEGGSMATLCLRERPGLGGGEPVFFIVDCKISRKRAAGSFRSFVHVPLFPNSIVKSNSFSLSSRTE